MCMLYSGGNTVTDQFFSSEMFIAMKYCSCMGILASVVVPSVVIVLFYIEPGVLEGSASCLFLGTCFRALHFVVGTWYISMEGFAAKSSAHNEMTSPFHSRGTFKMDNLRRSLPPLLEGC